MQLEEDFVYNFMSRPRCSYEACFQQTGEDRLRPLHPEGNLLVVLQEVSLLCIHTKCITIQKKL